jgi:hypothetical protein
VILRFLEKNPDCSSRDLSKILFTPKTTILQLLANLGLKSDQVRWILHGLLEQQKQQKSLITGDET